MHHTSLFSTLFLILSMVSPVVSQNLVRGTVTDNQGQPLADAVVTLIGRAMSCTTKTDGQFIFSPTNVRPSGTPAHFRQLISLGNKSVDLTNPQAQNVSIALFDLRGKLISRLQNGMLGCGKHSFSLPQFNRNQIFIVQAQIGSIKESFKTTGMFSSEKMPHITSSHNNLSKTAILPALQIKVTHSLYDQKTVDVGSSNDSLIIRLNGKINYDLVNTFKLKDTLSLKNEGFFVVFDSIVDQRCPCDLLCEWRGEASIYLTLIKNGILHPVKILWYEMPEVSVEGYSISLEGIDSCRQDLQDSYTIEVMISPVDSLQKILFVEHFIRKDGSTVYGLCSDLHIDFPTYFFSEDTRILSTLQDIPNSTKVILGDGLALNGAAGAGISSLLYPASVVPFTKNGVTIEAIGSDGSVQISYRDRSISIAPGESWNQDTSYNVAQCESIITSNDRISNFGFISASQINHD